MTDLQSQLPDVTRPGAAASLRDLIAPLPAGADAEGTVAPLGGPLKRGFDLVVATTAMLVLLPVTGIVALLVLATMGRPVFFRHERVGFQRRMFGCHKFRSMVRDPDETLRRHLARFPDAAREWEETQKLRRDPRVTFIGRMLRKSSLDELPQLLNVLRGEMSCVGPRPVTEEELSRYGVQAPLYLSTRPGMTGLWQVSGRSSVDYARRVGLDELYVRSWSPWLDVRILLRTVVALLKVQDAA